MRVHVQLDGKHADMLPKTLVNDNNPIQSRGFRLRFAHSGASLAKYFHRPTLIMEEELRHQKVKVPRLRLRVTAAAETSIRGGHPWVYSNSVREQNRKGITGELAVIYDREDRFLAAGLYDAGSPIRVRVLHVGKPQAIDKDWLKARLVTALSRRQGLFDSQTTGFRWINGESDGWPGMVLDNYDRTVVLKLYTASWLPQLHTLQALILEQLNPQRLVLRLSRNIQHAADKLHSVVDGQAIIGPPVTEPVIFLENRLRFEADVLRGQKTGFFLDQRENRVAVEALAAGRRVLNTFSFTGAFSLYAARGGAGSVTDLDISPHAVNAAARNFALNNSDPLVRSCAHETIQADAFEWLTSARTDFDLIILDPPSLAKRESERTRAIGAYGKLASSAAKLLSAEGILVACSCSAHVTAAEFFESVRKSTKVGKAMLELKTSLHPPDHPASIPEAHYLKAIYLKRQAYSG